MRRFVLPIAGLALSASVAVPALAQDSTPEGGTGGGSSRIISPAECVVEPRAAEEVYNLVGLGDPGAVAATPAATNLQVPLGEPAPADVRDALQPVIREWIACLNGNDRLRAAALFTDPGVRNFIGDYSTAPAEAQEQARTFIAAAEPREEDQYIRYIATTDQTILPDGRAAAFVVINEPAAPPAGPETLLLVFAQEGEDWRIDQIVDFTVVVPAAAGTPEATPEA